MLTKEDIQLLIDNFVTKSEFNAAMGRIEGKMATKEELHQTKSDLMTSLDAILVEVKATREELAINNQQHEEMNHQLQNHEKRIRNLEAPIPS